MRIIKPAESIKKQYLKKPVGNEELHNFNSQVNILLSSLSVNDEHQNEDKLKDFLRCTFYKQSAYDVNSFHDIDLVIASHNVLHPSVLFELKAPYNQEMVTQNDINRKALHELILYFVLEECQNYNTEITQLIITNGIEWFLFERKLFYRLFSANKSFANSIIKAKLQGKTTDFIYTRIIKPYVTTVEDRISVTYIDFRELQNIPATGHKMLLAYKLLSPTYLFCLPFVSDHNSLNSDFYNELLYIMGVREVTEDGTKKIKRYETGRQTNSLIEQACYHLDEYALSGEETFEAAMGLVITWINRLLFLKLLESQLLSYRREGVDMQKFLNINRIKTFDELNELFLKVLALPEKSRPDELKLKFPDVPYLNSSLFEISHLERKYFLISGIKDGVVQTYSKTVLKKPNGKKFTGCLPLIEYIFRFLDSYDFGSIKKTVDDSEGEGTHITKPLINASVLGLIFEKINGYKDGSFFTPGYITEHICRKTLRKAIVDKFNAYYPEWNCKDYEELADKIAVDIDNRDKWLEANAVINSLTICDPAVGSGHFLVSALNELIAIKRDLRLLLVREERPYPLTRYYIKVEDDELVMFNADGEPFVYDPTDDYSNTIQKTLFEEKRTIIENCLYGVDINPKSVEICCLRLWIELLKNAYYYYDEDGVRRLQTLPNIDINIKTGNSLISRYPFESDKYIFRNGSNNRKMRRKIAEYKCLVTEYKNVRNKLNKRKVDEKITELKDSFRHEGIALNIFDETANEEAKERSLLAHSLEWSFEFPEIITDDGKFKGFDVIIGNPPYGVSIKGDYRAAVMRRWGHVPDFEIYHYFSVLAQKLLRKGGRLSYIIPNTWLFNVYAASFREGLLDNWTMEEILDCSKFKIFDSAGVVNTIIFFVNQKEEQQDVGYRSTAKAMTFNELIGEAKEFIPQDQLLAMNQNWGLAFKNDSETNALVIKLSQLRDNVDKFFQVTQGYIPYRLSDLVKTYGDTEGKRIKEQRLWHSSYKTEEHIIQEIYGEDITKFTFMPTGEYVKYGEHVATYVDMKFFSGKRILVREITNPTIIACIIDKTYVNDPQLLPVIYRADDQYFTYELLWAILNSSLAKFYHFNHSPKATKGMFPKILVKDLKEFPLPTVTLEQKSNIESLVAQVHQAKIDGQDTTELEKQIDNAVFELYNISDEEKAIIFR